MESTKKESKKNSRGKNKQGFTIIPNNLIYNTQITHAEFRVLVTLMSFSYGNNPSFPSQETVAKSIGKSSRSVRTHIKSLKKKGYIEYSRRGFNKSNQYTFPSVRKKSSYMKGNNLPPNNTSNKTINNSSYKEDGGRGMEQIRDTLKRKGVIK